MGTRIRVAIAQIHALPAYATQVVNHLFEPAPPLEKASTYLANIRNKSGISLLMNGCHSVFLRDLDEKLRAIATHSAAHKIHLLLLPEYAVPRELLAQVRTAAMAGGYVVLAGSHLITTTEASLVEYRSLGFDFIAKDPAAYVRKAMAPVFFPDGNATFGLKKFRSKWESDLITHDGPHAVFDVVADGGRVRVELRICIDAIASADGASGEADLLAVMARTPSLAPFQNIFAHQILRETPCVFANDAFVGGSEIHAAGSAVDPAWKSLLRLGSDEALLIADLDIDAQFRKLGSVHTPTPVALVTRAPLLYERVPEQAEVSDYVVTVRSGLEVASTPQLARLEKKRNVPEAMKTQLQFLHEAIENGTAAPTDINILLDCVPMGRTSVPFWNRCEQALRLSSHAVSTLLAKDGANQRLLEAMQAIAVGLRVADRAAFASGELPPSFIDGPLDGSSAPFVNREAEQQRLRDLLRENNVVAVYGLPGIGKRSLVDVAIKEELPRLERHDIHCVPDMGARRFLGMLAEAIGRPLDEIARMTASAKTRLAYLLVVHDAEHICASEADAAVLSDEFALLEGTGITVVLVAGRALRHLPVRDLRVRQLDEGHLERVLEYWCRTFGVEAPAELVSNLHGHPLAAKLAARLLRDGNPRVLDRLTFLNELRSELVENLLNAVRLSEQEKKVLEALTVFRRPVEDDALAYLTVEEMAAVDSLEERFLVDRADGRIRMTPVIRWAMMDRLKPTGGVERHHAAASSYYQTALKDAPDRVARFEAREEAIYHFVAGGNLKAAHALGRDWDQEAHAAVSDLYRRKEYDRCNEVCEAILNAKGPTIDILSRSALCLARRRKWHEARERLAAAQKLGVVPTNFLTGYGEALVSAGLYTEGIPLLEQVVTATGDAYATAVLADAFMASNDIELAKKWALEALEANPTLVRALNVASRVARLERNYKEAYVLARRAMAINPDRAEQAYNKVVSAITKANSGGAVPEEYLRAAEEAVTSMTGSRRSRR